MKDIVINRRLQFDYCDLIRKVDLSKKFTLSNVFDCIFNSKISRKDIAKIIRCNYLHEYIKEAYSKKAKSIVDYIQLTYIIDKGDDYSYDCWHVSGVQGDENYCLEYAPIYEFVNCPIVVNKFIYIEDCSKQGLKNDKIEIKKSITLIELLYALIYELSWHGSIENRNKALEKLNQLCSSDRYKNI